MQENNDAKIRHRDRPAINFWLVVATSYPTLASHGVSQSLIFPSTWECEQGFLTFLNKIKKAKQISCPYARFLMCCQRIYKAAYRLFGGQQTKSKIALNYFVYLVYIVKSVKIACCRFLASLLKWLDLELSMLYTQI